MFNYLIARMIFTISISALIPFSVAEFKRYSSFFLLSISASNINSLQTGMFKAFAGKYKQQVAIFLFLLFYIYANKI